MTLPAQQSSIPSSGQVVPAGHEPANLGDILERVLDRGVVIAGDIKVSLLDIELLTLKLRLVVASVDTARQIGIDWWENDRWLVSQPRPPVEHDGTARQEVGAGGAGELTAGRADELETDELDTDELESGETEEGDRAW